MVRRPSVSLSLSLEHVAGGFLFAVFVQLPPTLILESSKRARRRGWLDPRFE